MRFSCTGIFLAALMAASPALAQSSLLQAGPVTPGHQPMYSGSGFTQPLVQDGGGANGCGASGCGLGANPSELGLTIRSPTNSYPATSGATGPFNSNFCTYDAPVNNATGYHFFCLSPNYNNGGAVLSVGSGGGASQSALSFNINGFVYPFSALVPNAANLAVPNNAALSALASTYASAVIRMGYSTAGDSPALIYTPSNTACTLSTAYGGGLGDGISQVPTSDGKCWLASAQSLLYATPQDAGAKGNNSQNDTVPITNYIAAMGGNALHFPVGQYLVSCTGGSPCNIFTSTVPLVVHGTQTGNGPGPGSQANANVTQFMMNCSNCILFSVTSQYPSTFDDFQVNVAPSARPMVGGGGIQLIGGGGGNVSNYRIHHVGFTNVYQPINIVRPSVGEIFICYFDGWGNSAIYLTTTSGVEAAAGNIHDNYMFGTSATSTAPIYSEIGYTIIRHNWIIGGPEGISFNIKNGPAGFVKIEDNTIENWSTYGIVYGSGDGSSSSMVFVQNNEFFGTNNATSDVVVLESVTTPTWLYDLHITGNITRTASAAGGKHIWVQAGQIVHITGNTLNDNGANNATGIQVSGATINTGLGPPFDVSDNHIVGTTNKYSFVAGAKVTLRDVDGMTYASVPGVVNNGSQVFFTDGQPGGACAGSSTGSMGFYQNSAWKCF